MHGTAVVMLNVTVAVGRSWLWERGLLEEGNRDRLRTPMMAKAHTYSCAGWNGGVGSSAQHHRADGLTSSCRHISIGRE